MKFNYYQIINIKNNKKYIGITEKEVNIRFKEHKNLLNKNKHPNYNLQKDWNLFGEENFVFSLIESCYYNSLEEGYEREHYLISNSENLYNIAPGGRINPMYSKEIKGKMIKTKQDSVPNIYQLEEIEENVFKVINKFNSQKEAQKLTGLSQANISRSIKEKVKGSGYYWIEENQLLNFEKEWKPKRTKFKPTAQLNEKEEIIKVHHNQSSFDKEYGWGSGCVRQAVAKNWKAHGIKFISIDESEYYKIKPITLIF